MERIAILVSEAQPIVVEGLQKVLASHGEFEFLGWVARLSEASDAIRTLQPRVLLTDQNAGMNSIARFVTVLKNSAPSCHTVLWTNELSEADALHAVQIGVRGVIRKTALVSTLVECLREVATGRVWMEDSAQIVGFLHRREASRLTAREREVVLLICGGLKNKQIAEKLGITPGTVKVHLMHIFEKTGLKDRFALAVHGRNLPGIRVTPEASPDGPVPVPFDTTSSSPKDREEPGRSEVGV